MSPIYTITLTPQHPFSSADPHAEWENENMEFPLRRLPFVMVATSQTVMNDL